MGTTQEKPAWVTQVENTRREMGLPTVSEEFSRLYDAVDSGTSANSSSSGGYVAADPQGADNYHAKYSANEGRGMTPEDLKTLETYGKNWNAATTQEEKDHWHQMAEDLRALYGYSGGEDGSEYLSFVSNEQKPQQKPQSNTQPNSQQNTTSDSGYDLTEYLKKQAEAKLEGDLANLKYAYDNTIAEYDATASRVPQTYQTGRNNAAAQNALEKKSFDELAAAYGFSSGASGQAALARSSAYQRTLADLDTAQANALSQIDLQKAGLKREYENAVAQAKSTGNADLANALYQELVRVQNLRREDAMWNAQMELEREKFAWDQEMDRWQMEMTQNQTQWDQDMDRWQMEMTEQELALKYAAAKGSSSGSGTKNKSYDNGSLTTEQVKIMQSYYGLTPDGMWGADNKKTTGMTAEKAWDQFVSASQYLGYQKPVSSDLTSATFYKEEGIVVWNGTAYHDTATLKRDIAKAGLTQQQLEALEDTLTFQGFVIDN